MSYQPIKNLSIVLALVLDTTTKIVFSLVDTPDPQFVVTSPKTKRPHLKQFKTHNIKDNVTEGFIDETFKFPMPKGLIPKEKFPIEVNIFKFIFSFFHKTIVKLIIVNTNASIIFVITQQIPYQKCAP